MQAPFIFSFPYLSLVYFLAIPYTWQLLAKCFTSCQEDHQWVNLAAFASSKVNPQGNMFQAPPKTTLFYWGGLNLFLANLATKGFDNNHRTIVRIHGSEFSCHSLFPFSLFPCFLFPISTLVGNLLEVKETFLIFFLVLLETFFGSHEHKVPGQVQSAQWQFTLFFWIGSKQLKNKQKTSKK